MNIHAENKTKSNFSTVCIDSSDALPKAILDCVHQGKVANTENLDPKKKSIVKRYNRWVRTQFNKMDYTQKKKMKEVLKKVNTFSRLKLINLTNYKAFKCTSRDK